MTSIAVVTPWRDHLELASDFWQAISVASATDDDEIIVVDNASEPPLTFAAIRLDENRGFSGGSNAGLEAATTDAVLFLNNDIAVTSPDWLDKIRNAIEPGVLVGARLRFDRHSDVDGTKMPYLDGWCLAGMRDELLDLGGFDEGLEEPAYYSDNLLCLEARAAGMTLREVVVGLHHKSGATSQPQRNPDVQRVTNANRMRYVARARELLVPA